MESNDLEAKIESELKKIGDEVFRVLCRGADSGLHVEDEAPGLHTVGRLPTDEEAKLAASHSLKIESLVRTAICSILKDAIGDRKELITIVASIAKRTSDVKKKLEKNQKGLSKGRTTGAMANKNRADAIKTLALKMNEDLLTNPATCQWGQEQRARHIVGSLASKKIEVEGKKYSATMSGKPYSIRRIKDIITAK